MVKVSQYKNRNGKKVANHYVIVDDKKNVYFQSYDSIIVKVTKNEQVFLDRNFWNYSKTTAKYRNYFLEDTTEGTKEKIKTGEYILVDLN